MLKASAGLLATAVMGLSACGGAGGPSDGGAQLVGIWQMHTTGTAGESLDVRYEFLADGTVNTTINQFTACSGTTPIPTRTTRNWSVSGIHIVFTVMSPDSCGTYPILACLSDTGIPCTDLPTETLSFSLTGGTLTLTESAHGRENGSYTHP